MPATKKTPEQENETKADMLTQNMRFYTRVMNTPKEAQKEFNNGRFKGTDINPMWRIQKLTELFGPAGVGWWTQNVKYEMIPWVHDIWENGEKQKITEYAVFCTLELVYIDPETKEESKPIMGVGGNMFVVKRNNGLQLSDEAYKMAYTDAVSIACKALGFSHDIYYQKDRTKYTMYDSADDVKTSRPDTDNVAADMMAVLTRIQNGIKILTKDMDAAAKGEFSKKVIVPIIGTENYRECKDMDKLNKLVKTLLDIANKQA